MAKKKVKSEDRQQSGYLFESARPFTSLIFILPMLLAYEGGIIFMGPKAVHNGAATWLQNVLSAIGLGQYVLLPLLTCSILLGWHYLSRNPWTFSPWVLLIMFAEAAMWALVLWGIYLGYSRLLGVKSETPFELGQLIGYFGAGIYEELLFRVLLVSGIVLIIQNAGADRRASYITAIGISAILFALAHYNIFYAGGTHFTWTGVLFHTICGVYFGVLFTLRGFGITAGAHALYNVCVMLFAI